MPNALAAPPQAPGAPQQQQKTAKLADVKDMIHKQATVDRELAALLKEGGPIQPKEVLDLASRLVAKRIVTAQQAAGYLSDLPDDPNKVREWCERHKREADSVLDQLLQMIEGIQPGGGDMAPPDQGGMMPPAGGPDDQGQPPGGGGPSVTMQ